MPDLHDLMHDAAAAPARPADPAFLRGAARRRRRRRVVGGAALAVVILLAATVPLTRALRPTVDFSPAEQPTVPAPAVDDPSGEDGRTPAPAERSEWEMLPDAPIAGRTGQAGVWTGSELVVWGGYTGGEGISLLDDGAAYDPVRRSWRTLAPAGLSPRHGARAVWTGSEVLVWGGMGRAATPPMNNHEAGDAYRDGARYDPTADTWTPMAPFPLAPRSDAAVVWAGGRLVVWGGVERRPWSPEDVDEPGRLAGRELGAGAVYDPATDAWTPMAPGPLAAGAHPVAVSTGDRALLAGGHPVIDEPECLLGEAHRVTALYDPATNTWEALPDLPATPHQCRTGPIAAWTGDALLVWFGDGAEHLARAVGATAPSGARLHLAERRWDLDMAPAPVGGWRMDASAVWTGEEMVVWGGVIGEGGNHTWGDGAAYNPDTNTWRELAPSSLADRAYHTAVWTGDAMLVWGGSVEDGPLGEREYRFGADGAAYRPPGPPEAAMQRYCHALAHRDVEMVNPILVDGDREAVLAWGEGHQRWLAALVDIAPADVGDAWQAVASSFDQRLQVVRDGPPTGTRDAQVSADTEALRQAVALQVAALAAHARDACGEDLPG